MFSFFWLRKQISFPGYALSLLLVLFFSASGSAQNYFFDTYGVSNGLAQSTVFDILQDNNHYIWLGTRAGVSRFDGRRFINYTTEEGLAGNGVRVLYQDSLDQLWMGHYGGGISIYDGMHFRVFSVSGKAFTSDITSINSDAKGNIWITSEGNGAMKISKPGKTIEDSEKVKFIGDKLSDRIYGTCSGSDGNFYFIIDAFVKVYNPDKDEITSLNIPGMPRYFQVTSLFEDSKKNLWFGTHHGGLYKYIVSRDTFKVYDIRDGLTSNWISTIAEDHNGNIWVGTWGGGISSISESGLQSFDTSNGLPDLNIRMIREDAEGNILIGTEEHGMTIFKGEKFVNYNTEDGLADPQVWSVEQDKKGTLWFGTNNGISTLSINGDQQFEDFPRLKGNKIRFIKEDVKGRVWIAAENQGVFTWDPDNRSFTYEPRLNSYISSLNTTALETDDKGIVWAGTNDGLVSYDITEGIANYYTQINGLGGNDIKSLYFAPDGRLWIGSRGTGLTYMLRDSFYQLQLEEKFTANCMVMGSDGNLWVGTEAKGVLIIDLKKERIVKSYKEADGLLASLINLIETGDDGKIYIGTNKGLNVYDPEEDKVFTYGEKSGFTGIETKSNSVLKDSESYLWFGTVNGIVRFNPFAKSSKNEIPLTHIISFKVNRKERNMVQEMSLNYRENDISFDYISICLSNPDAVKYQIILEGTDNDWRPVSDQTTAFYPSLVPKKYTFRVRARNSEGFWNENPVSYSFVIKPPFYQTSWFIFLSIITGIMSIFVYVKVRERSLVREKRVLEDKVMERTIEVVEQKEELAQKNKDITDSIRYARRLQKATLPPSIPFENTFVLFKPKDIVSGDFYWFESRNGLEFMAAVDCTGHGVPGAFMSIIGMNSLNKIIREKGILQPSEILKNLNEEIIFNLKSGNEESTIYDGMDIALVCFDPKRNELQYSGGFNPLIVVRNGEIIELKADRFSIGRSTKIDHSKDFTNHVISIEKGDQVYIFTDGYADQFGGVTGKKFKYKPMKELLLAIGDKDMDDQRNILDKTMEAWRGSIDQIDDILIIGRRF